MWDIGAHWGHYSIFGASIAEKNNQIFAFEPDNSARKTLLSNLALNGFEQKVTVFDSLISDIDGELDFLDLGGNSNSHIVKNSAGQSTVRKKTRTLNSLLNDLPVPDFIKIDTEGAEIDILRSGSALLNNHKVRFICELHPFAWDEFKVQYSEFQQLVKDSGRTIRLLDEKKQLSDLPFYGTVLF
jgi:FkbM family methyltransferase